MAKATKAREKSPPRSGGGWQAEKSAITRKSILDAAVECFIDLGYANTTTALIAEHASVSRGAMMHHFPSRQSVLKAVVDYLHELRLSEYKALMKDIDVPDQQLSRERIRDSVESAWKYVNTPSFIAYQELLAASRTDSELNSVLQPVEAFFEGQFMEAVRVVFPHWQDLDVLDLANDLVQFTMRGMALSHMASNKEERARRILDYLTGALDHLYTEHAKRSELLQSYEKQLSG